MKSFRYIREDSTIHSVRNQTQTIRSIIVSNIMKVDLWNAPVEQCLCTKKHRICLLVFWVHSKDTCNIYSNIIMKCLF